MIKPLYIKDFINSEESLEIFAKLEKLIWLSVTDARQEHFMSDVIREYSYGRGRGERTYTSHIFIPEVLSLKDKINQQFGTSYNVCFLNKYDTFKQRSGWHSDDSDSMDNTHPIAVISFGAEREIWWKLQDFKGDIPAENKQKLHNGSLFIMPPGFQDLYFHRIPKHDRDCSTRSLTFRKYI